MVGKKLCLFYQEKWLEKRRKSQLMMEGNVWLLSCRRLVWVDFLTSTFWCQKHSLEELRWGDHSSEERQSGWAGCHQHTFHGRQSESWWGETKEKYIGWREQGPAQNLGVCQIQEKIPMICFHLQLLFVFFLKGMTETSQGQCFGFQKCVLNGRGGFCGRWCQTRRKGPKVEERKFCRCQENLEDLWERGEEQSPCYALVCMLTDDQWEDCWLWHERKADEEQDVQEVWRGKEG